MHRTHALVGVLPLCHQVFITIKSMENDFAFIMTSLARSDIPDYGVTTQKMPEIMVKVWHQKQTYCTGH